MSTDDDEPLRLIPCDCKSGLPCVMGWWWGGDFKLLYCDKCGTPCGDECCGVYEDLRADEIRKAWGAQKEKPPA